MGFAVELGSNVAVVVELSGDGEKRGGSRMSMRNKINRSSNSE